MTEIRKVIVWNRGECAARIFRTLRKMNIKTVAVYTKEDRACGHRELADEAYEIPDYNKTRRLRGRRGVVRRSGADAVHPGWGFLSEDPQFPRECRKAGIAFLGPSEDAMKKASHKEETKKLAEKAGIPIILGTPRRIKQGEVHGWASDHGLSDIEGSTAFMIKAALGGGGGGNEVVYHLANLDEALERISERARRYFRKPKVFLEQYILGARHVEVQVARDRYGNSIHFGTRECSIQYLNQKMVEIAPAPNLALEQKEFLYASALSLLEELCYVGIATIEFLIDQQGAIYFLEINPRLQVEHGTTEMVTGIDLVELQISIAQGEPLPWSQDEIVFCGYAVEARINAHRWDQGSLFPSGGTIEKLNWPGGDHIRVEHALYEGYEINTTLNATQAKVLAHGDTYRRALAYLRQALGRTTIEGLETNIPLLTQILDDERVKKAVHDTTFLPLLLEELAEGERREEKERRTREIVAAIGVALALALQQRQNVLRAASANTPRWNPWVHAHRMQQMSGRRLLGWRR